MIGLGNTYHDGHSNQSYRVVVTTETYTEPELSYSLFPLELVQDDRHRMQEDPSHLPHPRIHPKTSSTFTLPAETTLLSVSYLCLHLMLTMSAAMLVFCLDLVAF